MFERFKQMNLEDLAKGGEEKPDSDAAYARALEFEKRRTMAALDAGESQKESATAQAAAVEQMRRQVSRMTIAIWVAVAALVIDTLAHLVTILQSD